jgi:hypothetical protein
MTYERLYNFYKILKLYGSLTELCNDTLCYQETGNFHAKDCIERSCDQCGVHLIKFSQYELSTCNEWNGKKIWIHWYQN